MKKLLLLPILFTLMPTSAFAAEKYMVTFNADLACKELMQYGGTDEYTLEQRYSMCLQMFSYFDTKYPR